MARIKRDPKTVALAQQIIDTYNPQSAQDMDEALKDIFGPLFESMLQGEMNNHLGYASNSKEEKKTLNRRNGYSPKKIKTSRGELDINIPRDREASLNRKLFLREREMFRTLKIKSSQCMQKECLKEIYQPQLKISMDFRFLMK